MSDAPTILCRYEGEGEFKSVNAVWARRADVALVIGEQYYIEPKLGRSELSHRHFFALINDMWSNLPERLSESYPTPDHLRKYALIRTGFYDSHQLVCSSIKEANKIAAFIRPVDEYSIVSVDGKIVTRFVAKSQSYKAMGKSDFQRSKQAVMDFLSELIGAERQQLESVAQAAE